ncbi:hypothetical protein E4T44_06252 [Aureobasidium sp. EXF-8845]|nr:hypothetical protein E4T44_06252 [Aureobasidium sp. EXF-8845]KAI4847268.1 hypothetical protein E4T45_06859 [Aureobasidium sp. EXF-8846]
MLSLPLLAPQNEYSFFLSPHLRPHSASDTSHTTENTPNAAAQQSRRQNTQQTSLPTRQSLAQLVADEQAISHRKHNIRRFGAGWIKPPGVAKTLQAETEEKAEREEQEALQRREQMMMDMQAQQEVEENRNRAAAAAAEAEAEQEEGEGEEERDLDEEIPDAEGDEEEEDEDEDEDITDSDEEEEGQDEEEMQSELRSDVLQSQMQYSEIPIAEDITFNEESMFADTSIAALDEESREQERYRHLQEAELTGVAQDEFDLGIERDLDDSVPEAGSYQHTDSELEDSDEEEEEEQSRVEQQEDESEMVGAVMQRSRSSLLSRDVSSLLDSSFVTSSPAPVGRLRSAGHRLNQR